MSTLLLITVGGSPSPIVTAVQSLNPDRVIFICSTGSRGSISQVTGDGTPCEIRRGGEVVSKLPNLPTHLGLRSDRFNPDTDLVLLENPDDLAECYRLISDKAKTIQQTEPGSTPYSAIYADYTGGTKTMSLSLGMVALDYGLSLYLTTNATRENLLRVERGESTERAPTTLVTVERSLNQELPKFLQDYNYAGAIAALRTLLQSLELPPDQKRHIRELRDIYAGFDAWDRFDHLAAWDLLSMRMKQVKSYGLALKRLLHSRQTIDPGFKAPEAIAGHGYELVEDLLLNAQRRAYQQRYDDAVGRIYRSLELLAQIRLQQAYAIATGDVDVAQLPESLRATYAAERDPQNGKVQLALWKSYTLLSQFPDDPLGQHFTQASNRLRHALEVRNQSLFAHGFKPITITDYQTSGAVLKSFTETALTKLIAENKQPPLAQFPTDL
ncbi:MAG: TIGR02710 family CRISPR-associated CARF protein [Leptolyngbyaceae cyanobacterium]